MVSHSALNIGTLCREFAPQWWQTLYRTQAQHLHFFHDSILFIWYYYLSVKFVMWIVEHKIENKWKLFANFFNFLPISQSNDKLLYHENAYIICLGPFAVTKAQTHDTVYTLLLFRVDCNTTWLTERSKLMKIFSWYLKQIRSRFWQYETRMGHPRPLFQLFSVFPNINTIVQQINIKN